MWAPELVWRFWSREESLAPAGIRSPDRRARSLVTMLPNSRGQQSEIVVFGRPGWRFCSELVIPQVKTCSLFTYECGQIINWQAKRFGISEELWVVVWKVEGSYWKEELNRMKVVVVLIKPQGAKDLRHHYFIVELVRATRYTWCSYFNEP
jgi:hypothetical protein